MLVVGGVNAGSRRGECWCSVVRWSLLIKLGLLGNSITDCWNKFLQAGLLFWHIEKTVSEH